MSARGTTRRCCPTDAVRGGKAGAAAHGGPGGGRQLLEVEADGEEEGPRRLVVPFVADSPEAGAVLRRIVAWAAVAHRLPGEVAAGVGDGSAAGHELGDRVVVGDVGHPRLQERSDAAVEGQVIPGRHVERPEVV